MVMRDMQFATASRIRSWTLLAWLAVVCLTGAAAAQTTETQFTAQADRTQVGVGETIVLSVTVENARTQTAPSTPDFGGLQAISGRETSHQYFSVNGVMRAIDTYRWQLRATREGTFVIGPSQISTPGTGGRTQFFQTQPITITVTRQAIAQLPADLQQENILPAQTNDANVRAMLEGRLFLRQTISNPTPYVGEPVILTLQLYNDRVNFQAQQIHPPEIQGAVVEQLFQATTIDYQVIMHGGRQFRRAPIWQAAITPSKPGVLTFDGFTLAGGVPVDRRGTSNDPFDAFFNDPFFGQSRLGVTLPTPPIQLDVRPLPPGQPADFTGTVGAFSLKASVDRAQVSEDDLVTVNLTLEGKGAIELAGPPNFPANADFELSGQNNAVEKEIQQDGIGGRKRFEFVLRPIRSGALEIPAFRYSLFDPFTAQYRTLQTRPLEVSVAPGRSVPYLSEISPAVIDERGELASRDLHYLLPVNIDNVPPPRPLFHSLLFWNSQAGALTLLAVVMVRDRRRNRLAPDQIRRAGALRAYRKRLDAFHQKHKRGAGIEALAAELEHAVRAFLADRFGLSPEGLTRPEIEQLLHGCSMPAERVGRLCDLLDACASIRYAPAGTTTGDISQWSDEFTGLLKECLDE